MKLLAEYTQTEQNALKTEVCPEATDDQINYFLRVCEARGIDPFSGLLYMQRRFNQKANKWKVSVQPTVDGSRAAASRTGYYAGSDEPEFDRDDAADHPGWCRVTVYRMVKGERFSFTAKCRWREFVPAAPNDFQWKAKPYHMLAKCTEVQALRKAFPECIPATGEDDYEDIVDTAAPEQPSDAEVQKTKAAIEWVKALQAFAPLGKKEADLLAYLGSVTGALVTKEAVTLEHIENLRTWYEELTQRGK